MLKSCGVVGGLQHFSVSPRPLGFGFGTKGFWVKGLGPGLDNLDCLIEGAVPVECMDLTLEDLILWSSRLGPVNLST